MREKKEFVQKEFVDDDDEVELAMLMGVVCGMLGVAFAAEGVAWGELI